MSADHDPFDDLALFGGCCNSMALRLFRMAALESPEAMAAVIETLHAFTHGDIRLDMTVSTGMGEPSRIGLTATNRKGEKWVLPDAVLKLGAMN